MDFPRKQHTFPGGDYSVIAWDVNMSGEWRFQEGENITNLGLIPYLPGLILRGTPAYFLESSTCGYIKIGGISGFLLAIGHESVLSARLSTIVDQHVLGKQAKRAAKLSHYYVDVQFSF